MAVQQAWEMYRGVKNVIVLRDSKRFTCALQKEMMATIRARQRVRDEVWEAFAAQFTFVGDPRLQEEGFRSRECLFAAKDWHTVAREQLRATRAEAAERGEVVHFVFSCDRSRHGMTAEEARAAWQHANSTDTGRLSPILGLYVGMRVRLMGKLKNARHLDLVNDATGTVVGFNWHTEEAAVTEDERLRGWRRCVYLPEAVLVEFDDHISKCGKCKKRWGACRANCQGGERVPGKVFVEGLPEGVLPVAATDGYTQQIYLAPGQKRSFTRRQIPLSHASKLTSVEGLFFPASSTPMAI